jgi:hypothetical protein
VEYSVPQAASVEEAEEEKLSFLLEDAQRDGSSSSSDGGVEEADVEEDEHYKGHPSLEDEGDPWLAPRRRPLDSAGESMSHPVSGNGATSYHLHYNNTEVHNFSSKFYNFVNTVFLATDCLYWTNGIALVSSFFAAKTN